MQRRTFLGALGASGLAPLAPAALTGPIGIGYNTYCLRGLKMTDRQHLDQAAAWNLDALFLQDSLDPAAQDPRHWPEVKAWAKDLGLHLETGGSGILPKSLDGFDTAVASLKKQITRAKAMGSPIVRGVCASDRASLPLPDIDANIALAARLLKAVKPEVVDAGVKIAIEIHKDFQAWEHKILIEEAGKDFVGTYLDTGNPVFVMEDPLLTLETLAPYVVTFHLRDSVVYDHPKGIAVQWVPLGEGTIDFVRIIERARQLLAPDTYIYIKPITGRAPYVHPVYDEAYWKRWYPKARAAEFSRFLAIAKQGYPYEKLVVQEDNPGQKVPDVYQNALAFQQKEHMERSIAYAKKVLKLGRKS